MAATATLATAGGVLAYVGLGANLGEASASVHQAMRDVALLPGCALVARSSLYRSAPVDAVGPDYINAVMAIQTSLQAPELLLRLHHLEALAGRQRPYRNAPRTLDLDLLLYGDVQLDTPSLTLPHPRMHQRAFVLLPLYEIAPQCVSPQALAAVRDQRVERLGGAVGFVGVQA
ncbi:MAG: 2-amino-4-hydroxy-6-hydroxymethyldihydropteridine diphosphokinase [Rhodoferax sp.]